MPELQLENDTTINNTRLDRSSDMVNEKLIFINFKMKQRSIKSTETRNDGITAQLNEKIPIFLAHN